jgi:hypothetical protein
VTKEVYSVLQDFAVEVADVLPATLATSSTTGRLLYLDRAAQLNQYSIADQKRLKSVFVGSRAPFKVMKILDCVFDEGAARLYTLTSKWIVEVWEPISQ